MTGTLYATLPELKEWLEIGDANDDLDLERALDAASRAIETLCGRQFYLSTAQTRLYYPDTYASVRTPDLVSVTTLKVDREGDRTYSVTVPATDYELWPLNGVRYQEIRAWPLGDEKFVVGRYVQVVGTFGCVVDGAAPVEVRQACLILASRYYRRAEAPFGVLSAVDLGQFARISKEDPDVAVLLGEWRLTGEWVMV